MSRTNTILDELAEHAMARTEAAKCRISLQDMKTMALNMPKGNFEFGKALSKEGLSFILECKKASPSKGLIADDFPYVDIAKDYEKAGADCISVLTEPKWFLGSNEYLKEIAAAVSIPCLRKDFTVDEYMIYEARTLGAGAVLLIAAILSAGQIEEYLGICRELGISAIVECHDEDEIMTAVDTGAKIIGVNNRNLHDFSVDNSNSTRLRDLVPADRIFVSESGIRTPEDVAAVRRAGADAVLIGETVMRAADKAAALDKLRSLV